MILKKSKRAVAAVIAAVSTAAMAASMAPAFAYEDIAAAQEAFVNSFDEGTDRDCAQYLLDNGCALDDAKDVMEHYMNGKAMTEANSMARSTSANQYYSNTTLASTDHFVVLISATPDRYLELATIKIYAYNSLVSSSENGISLNSNYCNNASDCSVSFKGTGSIWRHTIDLEGVSARSSSNACQVARIAVDPVSSTINNEAKLYNAISMSVESDGENDVNDYMFAYETYAKGDVNHDGVVDDQDSTMLLQFLAEKISSFDITYADGSNHYSAVTNAAAADFNLDGLITLVDLTMLTQYIS